MIVKLILLVYHTGVASENQFDLSIEDKLKALLAELLRMAEGLKPLRK